MDGEANRRRERASVDEHYHTILLTVLLQRLLAFNCFLPGLERGKIQKKENH